METSAVGTEVVCNGIAGEIGSNPTITSDDMKGHIATATVPLTVLPAGTNPPVCTATPNPAADGDAVTIDCTVDAGTTNAIAGADLLAGVKCTPNPATGTGAVSITCTGYGATIGNNPPVTSKDAAGRSTTGIVPLQIKQAAGLLIAFKVPVCTATPNPAQAGETVSITCTGGVVSDRLTIPGTNCAGAFISGKSITCTGTAGIAADQLNNNPAVTVLNESGIFNSGVVPFQIQGGTTAPPLPVCTAVPNPAGLSTSVTIACTGGTPGHTLTIAGSDCAGVVISDSGTAICSGKGGDLGNNPILTVATGPGSGNISQGTVPLFVKTAVPSVPVCKANPNPVSPSATVTITCTVDAGTTNTIAGAACTPPSLGGSLTCTGTGKDIGNDPTIASTNPAGNTTTAIVPLTVLKGPNPPVCTATPNPALGTAAVTITCKVDAGTANAIAGAGCTKALGTTVTCTGIGQDIGSDPTITSTDAAGNTSTATVPLKIFVPDPWQPCTATPNPVSETAVVTIACGPMSPGSLYTIPGAVCTTTGTIVICTGIGGTVGSNPVITSKDAAGNTGTYTVPLTVLKGLNPPVCTATPNPADPTGTVTITCKVDTGTSNTIPGATCAPNPATGTAITCTGIGKDIGSNPTITSKSAAGNTSTATVPLIVPPPLPVFCQAWPNPADAVETVTIGCQVDAGTTNTIPGGTCTHATGTGKVNITCVGTGGALGSKPTVTSTDAAGKIKTYPVMLTVIPTTPVCTASPSAAWPTDEVLIKCTVDKGTTTYIPGAVCTTEATHATCTGTGAKLGDNPPVTSRDAAGNLATGIVLLQGPQGGSGMLLPPIVPVCTAVPNPANPGADVTITCKGGTAGHRLAIDATNCQSAAEISGDGSVTCTGKAGTWDDGLNNSPTVTVTDPASGLSNSSVVSFQIQGSTTALPLPVCTATPNPAGLFTKVTIVCIGGTPGHAMIIDGSDCAVTDIDASGTATCHGQGDILGSNPRLTIGDSATGMYTQGTVPLTVNIMMPPPPNCTATPNPASPSELVTFVCEVEAGTVNTIPGAVCTAAVGTGKVGITCTGTGADVGSNPEITSTDAEGHARAAGIVLTVQGPTPPVCVATPNPVPSGATVVTIDCKVDAGTTNVITNTFSGAVSAVCTPATGTGTVNITCTGSPTMGSNPKITSTDAAGNSRTATVPLKISACCTPEPLCKATPNMVSASAVVTIVCYVDAGTTNTIPGAVCTPNPATGTTLTCIGTGGALGNDPVLTTKDAAGNVTTTTVPLKVLAAKP